MFFRISALAILVIFATLFVDQSPVSANGDRAESAITPCLVGRTAPPVGFWTWPANTHVNIYLRDLSDPAWPDLWLKPAAALP